jgi:hypothetical protein
VEVNAMELLALFLAQSADTGIGDGTYLQYGMAGAVIVVVVLFLRFLADERKGREESNEACHTFQRETVSSLKECIEKNTSTHARTAGALDRHETILARLEKKIDVAADHDTARGT